MRTEGERPVASSVGGARADPGALAPPVPPAANVSSAELLVVPVAYVLLGLWWLWPLPADLTRQSLRFPDMPQLVTVDFAFLSWTLAWVSHALISAPWDLFHGNMFHPSTVALAYADHLTGLAVLFAPAFWLTGDVTTATNVYLIALQPLAALSMYALARRFVDAPAAFVAGLLFGFAPGRLFGLAHFHILSVQYLPLALLFIERWLDQARGRDAVALALVLTLQGAASYYLSFALLFAGAIWVPLAIWAWRDRIDVRRLCGLALAAVVAGTVAFALSLPSLRLRAAGIIPAGLEDRAMLPFGLWPSGTADAVRRFLTDRSVGPLGYLLVLLALLPRWRGRGRVLLAALGLVGAGLVLAHGPHIAIAGRQLWSPYEILAAALPGLGTVRLPARFVIVAQIGLTLLAGIGTGRLLGILPRGARAAAATLVAIALLVSFRPLPEIALGEPLHGTEVPEAYGWLARHGAGRPLLEQPAGSFVEIGRRLLLGTVHWLPMVDGYSAYPPTTPAYLHRLAWGLPDDGALQRLVDTVDLGWLLVHLDQLPATKRELWNGELPDGLEPIGWFGDDLLLRVSRRGDAARQGRLLSTTETLDGAPLVALGPNCPGAIELAPGPPDPPDPWPAGEPVRLAIELSNRSEQPWPGLAFVRRHVVGLVTCFERAQGPACSAVPLALGGDVPAGGSLRVPLEVHVPRSAGEYVLRLELVQQADASLERCGLAPLLVPARVASPPDAS